MQWTIGGGLFGVTALATARRIRRAVVCLLVPAACGRVTDAGEASDVGSPDGGLRCGAAPTLIARYADAAPEAVRDFAAIQAIGEARIIYDSPFLSHVAVDDTCVYWSSMDGIFGRDKEEAATSGLVR